MRSRLARFAVVAGILLVTTACATVGGYKKRVASWVGSDVSQLIQSWGPPSQTYKMPDGQTMYTWIFNGGVVVSPFFGSYVASQRYCKTTFTAAANNVIVRWQFEGSACRA